MSDTPLTDAEEGEATFTESGCAADVVNADFARDLERRLQAALREVEEMRKWLDSHMIWCPPKQVPILASTSKRIWYHATDDMEHSPFTAVIDAALAEKGKP